MRKGFTLIEMMISIVILSIMMTFLYKSYASLNSSNMFYKNELDNIKSIQQIKKMVYLDFALILNNDARILNQERNEDVVMLQSSSSFHRKYNPYITYFVKDSRLYRLESLKAFLEYPLNFDNEFTADDLGEVSSFRVYKSNGEAKAYLINIKFKKSEDILVKVNKLH